MRVVPAAGIMGTSSRPFSVGGPGKDGLTLSKSMLSNHFLDFMTRQKARLSHRIQAGCIPHTSFIIINSIDAF